MGPAIERFQPDVIHANDVKTIYTAATAAARLRNRGHSVRWLYDAHEYVPGVDWPTPRTMRGYPDLEREFIHRAHAVVTVYPRSPRSSGRSSGSRQRHWWCATPRSGQRSGRALASRFGPRRA